MPVRVVGPAGVGGLVDKILTPAYATSIGLLRWGAAVLDDGRAGALQIGAGGGRPRPAPGRRPEHLALDPPDGPGSDDARRAALVVDSRANAGGSLIAERP